MNTIIVLPWTTTIQTESRFPSRLNAITQYCRFITQATKKSLSLKSSINTLSHSKKLSLQKPKTFKATTPKNPKKKFWLRIVFTRVSNCEFNVLDYGSSKKFETTQPIIQNPSIDQHLLANHINLLGQDQITIYPSHPSNIISGTYINSNIIVHNPNPTVAVKEKKMKVKLSKPEQ